EGLDHIYSASQAGMATLALQFKVGEDRTQAVLNLYNKVFSNQDWFSPSLAIGQPIIKTKGIDDVPILTMSLWSENDALNAYELSQIAHSLEAELKRVNGTRNITTIGDIDQIVHVHLDAQKLASHGISIQELSQSLRLSNVSKDAGSFVENNQEIEVRAGDFLVTVDEVKELIVGLNKGAPVYLSDVATISTAPSATKHYVSHTIVQDGQSSSFPSVTLAVAKKPGVNAVDVTDSVIKRMTQLEGVVIPHDVKYQVTRNYGETADSKANKLIQKLIFATASVILLVFFTMGWREALIVGSAVGITLMMTLFASWAWGFTINRVSLFALIFSIGILVDDAIVVVENIHRHLHKGADNLLETIPQAVDEVGGPTILATFTVIAALMPMAFVTGLMGPYMSPIPINASTGMLISLVIAFVVTPWFSYKIFSRQAKRAQAKGDDHAAVAHSDDDIVIPAWVRKLFSPFLKQRAGWTKRFSMGLVLIFLILLSIYLTMNQSVVMKMLPFDNKSEIQLVIDMPEGTPLEETARIVDKAARIAENLPELAHYQSYVGTASPIGFNGLVRQYYLRQQPFQGDIQLNLVDKHHRDRKSHDIARDLREQLSQMQGEAGAVIKVVEVPPGPPVLSPLVAEVYGLNQAEQAKTAKQIKAIFAQTDDIVDIDDSLEHSAQRITLQVDRDRAARLGISQQAISETVATLYGGNEVSFLRNAHSRTAVPIKLSFSVADKAGIENLQSIKLKDQRGNLVPLSELVTLSPTERESTIYHKDLLPVVFVTGDMAGDLDSPLYGLSDIYSKIDALEGDERIEQFFINQPDNPVENSIKWDGEWQITYETFRDMGIAYAIGLILIYLLVVAQFRSYLVPLIIMAPIPMTLIGVMPGHALMGLFGDAQFTATSMIGMIALAGIIVRNSILLVDFINQQIAAGVALEEAVMQSAVTRAKPIILTALAAMAGAFFILDDPIFKGLAISLIFGLLVSTLLTLIVIPIMYYAYRYSRLG
ncbi:MAG: efflux RND transporter permease subunit, partial [Arenicellales bacterium]